MQGKRVSILFIYISELDTRNISKGLVIEIKNIFNREITGIPKLEYWVQTQIQMETCDLDKCDFVETRFKEFETEEEFYQDTTSEYKGVILLEFCNADKGDVNP